LMRWFRKNNSKIMAIVVVIIMIGFIGGAYLRQLGRKHMPIHDTVAYFGTGGEITNYDLVMARQDLEILEMLRASEILRSQEVHNVLLGELLFSARHRLAQVHSQIQRLIRMKGYSINDKQINDFYAVELPKNICWFLLTGEADKAGIAISNEDVKMTLADSQRGLIPALFNGQKYSEVVGQRVNKQGISEEKILAACGKLFAVMEYASELCAVENMTTLQLMYDVSLANETINTEFVEFKADTFIKDQNEPARESLIEQFDRGKKFFPGQVTNENPYGFGYKLPERVRLEYIAIRLSDVAEIITRPTSEETEQFYQLHRDLFKEQIPADPNDPNSAPTERLKSYAESQAGLSRLLLQNKINLKANSILQQAKTLTDIEPEAAGTQNESLTDEQLRQLAIDYQTVASQLADEHHIRIYTGKTGLLTAEDIQQDEYLSRLYIKGYAANIVSLLRVVFAGDPLNLGELSIFDVPKPRMYETIGPLKDTLSLTMTADLGEQIMAVVRIIEAKKASEPEDLEYSFNQNTMNFDDADISKVDKIYAVADKVAEDLKRIAAMTATKEKVLEFIEQTEQDGWEAAIDKFNKKYTSTENNENEPNTFELKTLTDLPRITEVAIKAMEVQNQNTPNGRRMIEAIKKERLFRDKLYSLIPPDANTIDALPYIMEFKPLASYYCLKSISVKHIDQDEYEKIKGMQNYKELAAQVPAIAVTHYNPKNIVKRMNFRYKPLEQSVTDANTPSKTGGMP